MGDMIVIHRRIVKGNVPIVSGFNYIRNIRGQGTVEIFCSDDSKFTNITKSEAELVDLIKKYSTIKVDRTTFKRFGYNQSPDGTQEAECQACASAYTE